MARKKDGDDVDAKPAETVPFPGAGAQALLDAELAKLEAAKEKLTAAVDAEAELDAIEASESREEAVALVGEDIVAKLETAAPKSRDEAIALVADELASRRTPYGAYVRHNVDAHGYHATTPADPQAQHGQVFPWCTWSPR